MLLNHVQHEAVVRGPFEGCWVWTALSAAEGFLALPRLSRSSRVGHRRWWRGWKSGLRCRSYLIAAGFELYSRDGVLAAWCCVSFLVGAWCSASVAFFCCSIPLVSRRSWVSRLTQAHSSASAVRELVQRSWHRGGPTVIVRDPRFELEAARDGQVEVNALSVPHPIGTQTVRTESGDVKVEGSV